MILCAPWGCAQVTRVLYLCTGMYDRTASGYSRHGAYAEITQGLPWSREVFAVAWAQPGQLLYRALPASPERSS